LLRFKSPLCAVDPDCDPLTFSPVTGAHPDGSFDYTPTVPAYSGVCTVASVIDVDLSLAYPIPWIWPCVRFCGDDLRVGESLTRQGKSDLHGRARP